MRRLLAVLLTACVIPVFAVPASPAAATVDNVAIIVIDNFGIRPSLPDTPLPYANCAYAPEDSNVVGDDGAGDDLPAGVAHGTAVQSRLTEELDAKQGLIRRPDTVIPGIAGDAQRWSYGAQNLFLLTMDTNGHTTAELSDRLRGTLDTLRLSPWGITRVVLNMSFVIVPCNVPAWLDSIGRLDPDRTLAAYHALLALHPELGDLADDLADFPSDPPARRARLVAPAPDDPLLPLRILAAPGEFYGLADPNDYHLPPMAEQRLDSDPLKFLLFGVATTGPVVPVAASGNGLRIYRGDKLERTRFSFPFAPAVWDAVVAVSGGVDWQTRAGYSNNGEVVMEGTTLVARSDGTFADVHGSSFAAPRLSASAGTYLLTGGSSPCEGHLPVLGYTNSELGGQHWDDLNLFAAAKRYCDGYLLHTALG